MTKEGILALTIFILVSLGFLNTLAGSSDDPEITDETGDAVSNKSSHDIVSAWFGDETNDTISVYMNVTSLEPWTKLQDIPNLPTTEYEIYFTLNNENYAVVCVVPVHGPLGATISFELRKVSYGNDTNLTEERIDTVDGRYYSANGTIEWEIQKTAIGNPKEGDKITSIWSAVWFRKFGDNDRTLEDRAPDTGYGRDYTVRGKAGEWYEVIITAEVYSMNISIAEKAVFEITVANNGSSRVSIIMANSTPSKGWTCDISPEKLTLAVRENKTVRVSMAPPRDAKNGTVEVISVWANIIVDSNTTKRSDSISLKVTVIYMAPEKPEEADMLGKIFRWFQQNKDNLIMAIVIIVVLIVIVAIFHGARKKKKMKKSAEVVNIHGNK